MTQIVSQRAFDNPVLGIAVYTGGLLNDAVGRASELAAVDLLTTVFDLAELNYDIHYDFPIRDYPARNGICTDDTGDTAEPFASWRDDVQDGNIPFEAKDSNILLVDGTSGGCAAVGGNYTAVGATPLANFTYALSDLGMGTEGNAAASLLHELGHNLGSPGPGDPHFGYGFNDHQSRLWWRTPCVSGNGIDNNCGEHVNARVYSDTARYLFYHWCAVDSFQIVDYPAGATPPSEYPPTYEGTTAPLASQLPVEGEDTQCSVDSDCFGGFCVDGQCVSCEIDADCPGDLLCIDNECIGCVSNLDCPGDFICVDGRCEDPTQTTEPLRSGVSLADLAFVGLIAFAFFSR